MAGLRKPAINKSSRNYLIKDIVMIVFNWSNWVLSAVGRSIGSDALDRFCSRGVSAVTCPKKVIRVSYYINSFITYWYRFYQRIYLRCLGSPVMHTNCTIRTWIEPMGLRISVENFSYCNSIQFTPNVFIFQPLQPGQWIRLEISFHSIQRMACVVHQICKAFTYWQHI